ncbi:MAG: hypothetical protein ACLU5I_01120 [Alistipes finegoldii]
MATKSDTLRAMVFARIGGGFGDQRIDRLPHRDAAPGGQLGDALDGRVADAARG